MRIVDDIFMNVYIHTQSYMCPTFQNDFGLDTVKIPQKTRQSMYAPRDPAFKDTWRGRGRQDLCKVEVTKVSEVTFALRDVKERI